MGNGLGWVLILVVDLIVLVAAVYFLTRYLFNRFRNEQKLQADNIVLLAQEEARKIELKAKDQSLKLLQEAEEEIARRRAELGREDERRVGKEGSSPCRSLWSPYH